MLKRILSGMTLTLLLIGTLTLAFNIQSAKAEPEIASETEPSTDIVDFHNGTKLMTIDHGNGTQDLIKETFIRKTAMLLVPEGDSNQTLSTPLSPIECTNYVNTTQTVMMQQEVLLGFTYTIAKERYDITEISILVAYARAYIDVDIEFGLRLPVNLRIEYPEQMTIGKNYTFYATLAPIDKPDFNELLFTFKACVKVEAGILGLFGWTRFEATYGPDIDESMSFQTPLGAEAEIPLPTVPIMVFDSAWVIEFSLLKVFLTLEPAFGSEKITAKASGVGDARVVEGANLTWSIPNQRLNITVNADDYDDSTDYAKIILSDFKYYFTIFKLHVGFLFDLHDWIDWLTGDPEIEVATLDLSWIIDKIGAPYLPGHLGLPNSVYITVYVDREIPPPEIIAPRDLTMVRAIVNPEAVYAGRIVNITAVVANFGLVTESFNVTICYDNITIGTQPNIRLSRGQSIALTFFWDTTGLPACCTYTLRAEVGTVPNEIDEKDNALVAGTVKIKMFGDTNNDDRVDLYDIVLVATIYGCKETDLLWNPDADLAPPYGRIDIYDVLTCLYHYGQKDP